MPKHHIKGQCRLCHSEERLVDSHIIPNFQYKQLKEAEGCFYIVSTDPGRRILKRQKGITERILCSRCDNVRLSRYENHLAKVLFGGTSLDFEETGRVLLVRGHDYRLLKNAMLSILWRMSISTDPYFAAVDLGAKHEERLRLTLLNDSELDEEQFPILLTAPTLGDTKLASWTLTPDFTRAGGNRVYRCLISGLLFTFYVGSAPIDQTARSMILRRDNWPIIRAGVEEIPFLLDVCQQIGRANAVRGIA
jgi:hypothetical protein